LRGVINVLFILAVAPSLVMAHLEIDFDWLPAGREWNWNGRPPPTPRPTASPPPRLPGWSAVHNQKTRHHTGRPHPKTDGIAPTPLAGVERGS
jgi:hypothetical protein